MRSVLQIDDQKRGTLLRLRGAIDAMASTGQSVQTCLHTGWARADLPGSERGLVYGAVHEWFGLFPALPAGVRQASTGWRPPLSVLIHLARAATVRPEGGPKVPVVVWIGRRVQPSGHSLHHTPALFHSSIYVDAPSVDQRFWSIDVALRCAGSGALVVADASGLPLAMSRRLQLAAEAGGGLALLARPPSEVSELSAAATRWRVHTDSTNAQSPRWTVELVRCKGMHACPSNAPTWTLERTDDGRLVTLSPDLANRSSAAAAAP